jgi:hypothetical protein
MVVTFGSDSMRPHSLQMPEVPRSVPAHEGRPYEKEVTT